MGWTSISYISLPLEITIFSVNMMVNNPRWAVSLTHAQVHTNTCARGLTNVYSHIWVTTICLPLFLFTYICTHPYKLTCGSQNVKCMSLYCFIALILKGLWQTSLLSLNFCLGLLSGGLLVYSWTIIKSNKNKKRPFTLKKKSLSVYLLRYCSK